MRKQSRLLLSVLFIVALLTVGSAHGAPSQDVTYVDQDATGSNDGSSWTDAYTNLQDALERAASGDEIWVAEGVYYPDEGGGMSEGDRTASFRIEHDDVQLYGGFAGGESTREARDPALHITVLSGDIDQDDIDTDGNEVADTWEDIQGSNAYHVLWLNGVTSETITGDTVIDGFTVTGGQATGSDLHRHGGGAFCDGSGSGDACNPVLTNVTFSGNQAAILGGGMFNNGYEGESSPVLTKVVFAGNHGQFGGGMRNEGHESSPVLTNVIFSGNEAEYDGGGMDNPNASPILTNVTFSGNRAGDDGGGMRNTDSSPVLTNVVFSGNYAESWGGGMDNWGDCSPELTNVTSSGNRASSGGGMHNTAESSPVLVNCIIWENSPDNIYGGQPSISYSDVEGGHSGEGNIDADPRFADPVSAGEAPMTAGDYRLTIGSPAVDAGTNDPLTVDSDLDGNPRIVDGTGEGSAVVDMGAYELQISFKRVYLPLVLANR